MFPLKLLFMTVEEEKRRKNAVMESKFCKNIFLMPFVVTCIFVSNRDACKRAVEKWVDYPFEAILHNVTGLRVVCRSVFSSD